MGQKNLLVEIPRSEWTVLRDLYASDRTLCSGYELLQNYIHWISQNPEEIVRIFSLNGVWRKDGTFIVKDQYYIFCNTRSKSLARLTAALNCLDTNSSYIISGFTHRLLPAIEKHLIFSGLGKENINLSTTYWYHIAKEDAKQFSIDVPTGFTLQRLAGQHAEQINRLWPHCRPGSANFVERLIRYNESVGAFDRRNNLVAWCLILPFGALGLLQVADTHQRMGLGSLMIKYMARKIAETDAEIMSPVLVNNRRSRAMFEKLGFRAIDKVYKTIKP